MDYDRPSESACPHDGWYNGNPRLMIENGTFADFRHLLVDSVKKGKMKEKDIENYDKMWKAIPIAERKRRRDLVIVDTTPVPVKGEDGKIELRMKPSDNGAVNRRSDASKKALIARRAKGAISAKNDPLVREMEAEAAGKALSSAKPEGSVGGQMPAESTSVDGQISAEDAMAMGAKPVPMTA